jgi:hypothetical protein
MEVVLLAVATDGIVDFKLLVVLVHFEFAAVKSLGLDRGGRE